MCQQGLILQVFKQGDAPLLVNKKWPNEDISLMETNIKKEDI